jgi:hypothetical protein
VSPRCDLCRHWDYWHPDDMGVCRREGGPSDDVSGFVVPIGKAVLDPKRKIEHAGRMTTTCDTRCAGWQSDGTRKADEVERLMGAS